MKHLLFVLILFVAGLGCLNAQSNTIEIAPDFNDSGKGFETAEIELPEAKEPLEFIGLSGYHFDTDAAALFYRIKSADKWSPWLPLDKQHEFVAPNRSAYSAKPIEKPFSHIQFKTDKELDSELTFRFFLATSKEKRPQPIAPKSLNCDLPEVCARMCWCPTCPIDTSPQLTEPTHLIVHHSAGNNQSSDFSTVVEFIWDLHVNTNGWDDIGYNWLIDPNGVLYAGRPDGYQGAHFSCINENTVGICVIGDYTLVSPAEPALSTLVNLLAHEATEHAIDVTAQSYHATGDFTLDNVAGHRDGNASANNCSSTACPGDSFYPQLAEIRQLISDLPCYDAVSSLSESAVNTGLLIYPNPASDVLQLKLPEGVVDGEIEIFDALGRLVYRQGIDDAALGRLKIELIAGEYLVTVSSEGQVYSERVVVE